MSRARRITGKRAAWIVAALIVLNEIRGLAVVIGILWAWSK